MENINTNTNIVLHDDVKLKKAIFKYLKAPLKTDTIYIYDKDNKVIFDYPIDLNANICYDIVMRLNNAIDDFLKNEDKIIYPFALKPNPKCSIIDDCIVDLNGVKFLRIRGWGWIQYLKDEEFTSEQIQTAIKEFALNVFNSFKYGSSTNNIDIL